MHGWSRGDRLHYRNRTAQQYPEEIPGYDPARTAQRRHAALKKGPGGGYSLSRPAAEIRIGHVIRTLDGPLAPIRCASRTAYEVCEDCNDPETCQVRVSMTTVRDAVAAILDSMTLEEFAADKSMPLETLEEKRAG